MSGDKGQMIRNQNISKTGKTKIKQILKFFHNSKIEQNTKNKVKSQNPKQPNQTSSQKAYLQSNHTRYCKPNNLKADKNGSDKVESFLTSSE